MERENRALNDAGSFDYVDELYAEDVVVNVTRTGDDQPVVSRDDIKALYREWKTASPDLRVGVEREVVEGDTVVQYVTMYGTHEEPFRGTEPTGNGVAGTATLLGQIDVELSLEA